MPTIDIYVNTGQSAGTECHSTREGDHLTFEESLLTHPDHVADTLVDKGDPVIIGDIVGVALNGAAATTDLIAVDTKAPWWLNVTAEDNAGNSAVVRGDSIYINKTTCILSKDPTPGTHLFFGKALGAVSAGSTAVCAVKPCACVPDEPLIDLLEIIVSKGGNDSNPGTWDAPLLTIGAAIDLVSATRKTIYVMDGEYDEALTWPTISGVKLIGMNRQWGVVVKDSGEDDAVITVTPGAQSSTFEMWIENIYIDHGETGQDGIAIDNTAMTKKLNCYLRDVGGAADSASDRFIVTTQGDTDNAIRIYWNGQNGDVEGLIYLDAGNDGDRFYAQSVNFMGGLQTAADAVAFDIRLERCKVLHEGITGGNAAQTIHAICCYSQTGTTWAALDTNDLAGSHTEDIVA